MITGYNPANPQEFKLAALRHRQPAPGTSAPMQQRFYKGNSAGGMLIRTAGVASPDVCSDVLGGYCRVMGV
ncbi:MAG: hypothetical protein OXE79_08790 [Acidimicrobiaceae bacterium]|nr:hypothetical protein [Acidimicrobiaceae bacterium]MCY4175611.1 hypothetical protein [Acidimicrobiaceae bacterium]MCY4294986.1 hypothetical protein [Acidimicrobiaceae bacterium]